MQASVHAAMLTITPTIMPPMRHPVTIAQALKFLELHGHSPIMTPDGILVNTWAACGASPKCNHWEDIKAFDADDVWFQEPAVFPVVGNVVDLAPIREWQDVLERGGHPLQGRHAVQHVDWRNGQVTSR